MTVREWIQSLRDRCGPASVNTVVPALDFASEPVPEPTPEKPPWLDAWDRYVEMRRTT